MSNASKSEAQKYVGMELEVAQTDAEKEGLIIRARILDGHPLLGTCDYRPDRINVSVDEGVITSIMNIG